jgi:hypothetical protein
MLPPTFRCEFLQPGGFISPCEKAVILEVHHQAEQWICRGVESVFQLIVWEAPIAPYKVCHDSQPLW